MKTIFLEILINAKNTFLDPIAVWMVENHKVIIASAFGGFLQIKIAKKKRKREGNEDLKIPFVDIMTNFIIAFGIGLLANHVSILMDKERWGVVFATLAATSSNSLLNTFASNEEGFWKQAIERLTGFKLTKKKDEEKTN